MSEILDYEPVGPGGEPMPHGMAQWGETVLRPDELPVKIMVEADSQSFVEVSVGRVTNYYPSTDVLIVGNGSFDLGLIQISIAAYLDKRIASGKLFSGAGLPRWFNEEIRKGHSSTNSTP